MVEKQDIQNIFKTSRKKIQIKRFNKTLIYAKIFYYLVYTVTIVLIHYFQVVGIYIDMEDFESLEKISTKQKFDFVERAIQYFMDKYEDTVFLTRYVCSCLGSESDL